MNNLTNNFMSRLFRGTHDFTADTFKVALYEVPRSNGKATYNTTDESSGSGYTAGGVTATCTTGTDDQGNNIVTFDDVTFNGLSVTARSALIYNTSKSNRSVASLSLGDTDLVLTNQNIILRLSRMPIVAVRSEE